MVPHITYLQLHHQHITSKLGEIILIDQRLIFSVWKILNFQFFDFLLLTEYFDFNSKNYWLDIELARDFNTVFREIISATTQTANYQIVYKRHATLH